VRNNLGARFHRKEAGGGTSHVILFRYGHTSGLSNYVQRTKDIRSHNQLKREAAAGKKRSLLKIREGRKVKDRALGRGLANSM